jgi:tetratricopeptide (TPR) repeat protein
MPELGRVGHFRLIRPLGAGGMGEVFLAHDERLNRQVAIKRLRTSSDAPPERSERFQREARIAARLKHPSIVQIYELLSEGGIDCIVMEYVEGEDLRHRIEAAPLGLHPMLGIGQQIALAMAEAHDQGIIHRDLKTENVLITRSGQVKITDFGIAKDLRDETLTAEGHLMGTFRAMSPEQALGRPVDHRSDLFSFGILLYEALTGTSPFRAENPYLTLRRVVEDNPRPIRVLLPDAPATLDALLDHLLQKEPLLRPRNFHEVAQALVEIKGSTHAKPCTGKFPTGRPPLDTDGDTMPTGDPGPTADIGAAPARAGNDETETLTPAAGPAAKLVDAGVVSAMAATAPMPEAMLTPAEPATPAQAAPVQAAEPRRANRVAVPSARLVLPRSRRAAALVVAGAALALGLGYGIWRETNEPARRLRVAVPRPRVEAPAALAEADLMAVAVRVAIVRGLLSLDGIDAVPLDDVDLVTDGYERERGRRPLQRELTHAVGADELIAARLECTMQSCRVSLQRIVDGSISGEPAWFEMPPDDVRGPAQAVIAHLVRLFPGRRLRSEGDAVRVDPADYQELLRLRKAYWGGDDALSTDAILDRLAEIRGRSREFLELYRFEAEMLLHRNHQTGNPDDLARALELMREAEKQAPDAYVILASRFQIALEAREMDLAQDALRRLDDLDPGSGRTLLMHGQWHAHHNEHEEALELLQRAAARDSSWRILYRLASLEQEMGKWDAAHAHLVQLLDRSPGNYAGLSIMAQLEMARGNPACAIELYRGLVARRKFYEECNNLGVAQMMLDQYQDAAESFRCALAIRPGDPRASFNLAESLKLAGDEENASEQLQQLLAVAQNEDSPRTGASLMREAQVLAHLARHDPALAEQARALTRRVLAETPSSKQFLYPAAVVHALLGERDRAVELVRQLLDQGMTPDWFRFAWFDELRQHPELRERLTYSPPARVCE